MVPVILQNEWWPYLLVGLATWRLSHLLMLEVGPWHLLTGIRALTGVRHNRDGTVLAVPDGNIFECIYCLSMWVGLVFTLVPWWIGVPFALSTFGIIIHRRFD